MHTIPYLFFNGRSEEAIVFYKSAIGITDDMIMRFSQSPDKNSCAPGNENKVMHAQFKIGDTVVFLSDGECGGQPKFDGFALAINSDSIVDIEKKFNALKDGGAVTMPLGETFFAKSFGMVKDKFGMHWMLIVPKPM
ncbi:MAG: VOC family protein [Pseudolabrys sp.]